MKSSIDFEQIVDLVHSGRQGKIEHPKEEIVDQIIASLT